MPVIKPISDLRNYNTVLREVAEDAPVFLTKNGRGRFAIVDVRAAYPPDVPTVENALMFLEDRSRLPSSAAIVFPWGKGVFKNTTETHGLEIL